MPDANTLIFCSDEQNLSPLGMFALAELPESFDGYIEILLTGAWKGHWQGEFEITEAMIDQMVAFGNSRKIATTFEYGHDSFMGAGTSAISAGWVEPGNFEKRKIDGKARLFVKPDFTPKALAHVQSKEYRYVSSQVRFSTVDRKTGKWGGPSIHSIALTIHPFLEELGEIRANSNEPGRLFTGYAREEIQMKSITTMLGLTDGTAEEHIANAIKVLQDRADDFEGRYTALTAGLDGDPVAALAELQAKAATADAHAVALKAFEAEKASREASELSAKVDGAMKALQDNGQLGGVDSPEFKTWRAFAETDFARFSELSAALPKKTPVGDDEKKPKEKAANVALSDEQREINAKFGISDEVYLKHNTADQA